MPIIEFSILFVILERQNKFSTRDKVQVTFACRVLLDVQTLQKKTPNKTALLWAGETKFKPTIHK